MYGILPGKSHPDIQHDKLPAAAAAAWRYAGGDRGVMAKNWPAEMQYHRILALKRLASRRSSD